MPRPTAALPSRFALFLLLLGAVSCPTVAGAEEAADAPLRAGAWAAEFEFDPNLGYTGSATLAVKRHHSPGGALRLGVNVGFIEEERDGRADQVIYDPPYYPTPTGGGGSVDRHIELHSYAAFLHLVREWPVRDRVAMFGEIGPAFRYTESHYYSEYIYGITDPARDSYDEVYLKRSAALDVGLGFEWFFSKRVSLGARYGAFVAYQWGAVNFERRSVQLNGPSYSEGRERSDTKGFEARTNRATITLAAYF